MEIEALLALPCQKGILPTREVSLLPGGQNPISLEYQIHPPNIDTLATRMPTSTTILLILIIALRDLVAQWAQ